MSARVTKPVGQAVCAAALLGAALDVLRESDALTAPGRNQAKKAYRWFQDATCAALPKGLPKTTIEKTMSHAHKAAMLADKIMPDAVNYAPFIVGRIMAAWMFIEHQVVRHPKAFGREWRYLLQTTWTFLVMVMPALEQDEARIGRFADAMFVEFLA